MDIARNRILVVDDEPEIVDLLKSFLGIKGYEVSGALSGQEALSVLDEKKTDLMLLDIKMPGMQGTEVARIVKEKYPYIKIIVVTGYADEAENLLKNNLLAGLFVKPIPLQELNNKVVEIFHQNGDSDIDLKPKQGISARVLLLKAKLLFVEPSDEIYDFLSAHFKKLSNRGENYDSEVIDNKGDLKTKIALFTPDILVINAAALRGDNMNLNAEILGRNLGLKEIILYNIEDLANLHQGELEKLTKSIETVCLKNGLIEIKWVEI